MLVAPGERFCIESILDGFQQGRGLLDQGVCAQEFFFLGAAVAAGDSDRAVLEVARAEFDADRRAFLDPIPTLRPAADVAPVDFDRIGSPWKGTAREGACAAPRRPRDGVARLGLRTDRAR